MEHFALATRKKLRFSSAVGNLWVEDLWDLPLTAPREPTLDGVSRMVLSDLESVDQISLVNARADAPEKADNKLRVEVLKAIIAVKQKEAEVATQAAAKAAKKQKLLQALDRKVDEEIDGLSKDEIRAALDELAA